MYYHTLYQQLQAIQIIQNQKQQAFEECSARPKWQLHTPAVVYGLRRIRELVDNVQNAEYALVQSLVREVETELSIIKERLDSCSIT